MALTATLAHFTARVDSRLALNTRARHVFVPEIWALVAAFDVIPADAELIVGF